MAVYGSQYSYYENIKACVSNTPSGHSSNCAGITPYDCFGDVNFYQSAGQCHQRSSNVQCSCVSNSESSSSSRDTCYTFTSIRDGCAYLTEGLAGSYYNAHSMSIVCFICLVIYTAVLLFIYVQMTLHKRSLQQQKVMKIKKSAHSVCYSRLASAWLLVQAEHEWRLL